MCQNKCSFGDGIIIKPDGINELDPCIYKEIEKYANVTITISKCVKCGRINIEWEKQDDTEEIEIDEE